MTDLEHELRLLAADVEWPATPSFELRFRRRRPLLVGARAAALAVAAAFAVSQSRGAVLRFFHLVGGSGERVDTLPPASTGMSLGTPVDAAGAETLLGRPFAIAGVPLYRAGRGVSALLDGRVLLSELKTGDDVAIFKKFYGAGTSLRGISLAPETPALWLQGRPHVVVIPPALPAR